LDYALLAKPIKRISAQPAGQGMLLLLKLANARKYAHQEVSLTNKAAYAKSAIKVAAPVGQRQTFVQNVLIPLM
jgi:hypothetical protein